MSSEWKRCALHQHSTVSDAMQVIETVPFKIALILDQQGNLIGTVTDGDVRRGLLRGIQLKDPVDQVMNTTPHTVHLNEPRKSILELMHAHLLHQMPVIDDEGVVVKLEVLDEFHHAIEHDNVVVIMAGGYGRRLKDLTKEVPKPLLRVGEKPILETILNQFLEYGFKKFVISLGYKGDMIREYFKDGSSFNCSIQYVTEDSPLGTAGALSLLDPKPVSPFFVINGDILTKVDFKALLDFHAQQLAFATMCVRGFEQIVPYGVVELDGGRIRSIQEKPTIKSLVSAGIYILDPQCLSFMPQNQYYDMPSLFKALIAEKKIASAFPVHEYWIDIGGESEFLRAKEDYKSVF